MALVSLTFGGFPVGYCYPGDPNDFAADFLSATTVTWNVTGNYYYNYGQTVPSVDERVYPWLRTFTNAGDYDGWYYWSSTYSAWIQLHPVPASGSERRLWVGAEVDLLTYDGGENAVVGDTTGPFWEVDHDYDALIPMGPGTTSNGTTIAVATDYGADEVSFTLTEANLAPHYHLWHWGGGTAYNDTETYGYAEASASQWLNTSATVKPAGRTSMAGGTSGVAEAVDLTIIPPVRGTFVIKRTARIYRRVT